MSKVQINRERVLKLIKAAPVPISTKEMGRMLHVKERSVRAAITWLILGGYIKRDGYLIEYTTPGKYGRRKYKIDLYTWSGKDEVIIKLHTKDMTEFSKAEACKSYGDVSLLHQCMMGMLRNYRA